MHAVRRRFLIGFAWAVAAAGAQAEAPPRFAWGSVFQQDISAAPVHPQSASMIATNMGICGGDSSGCGFGVGRMQIDFSIEVMHADGSAPTRPIAEHAVYNHYYAPDCEPIGTAMPLPDDGRIEGSTNYACDNENNDCHLIVVQGNTLYEAYSANVGPDVAAATQVDALCLATWKLDAVYPGTLRGDHCTSADAAGFPIASCRTTAWPRCRMVRTAAHCATAYTCGRARMPAVRTGRPARFRTVRACACAPTST